VGQSGQVRRHQGGVVSPAVALRRLAYVECLSYFTTGHERCAASFQADHVRAARKSDLIPSRSKNVQQSACADRSMTLSECASGVNEPDGSPSGTVMIVRNGPIYCAICTFPFGSGPAERSIGATTEVPVPTIVVPPMSADGLSPTAKARSREKESAQLSPILGVMPRERGREAPGVTPRAMTTGDRNVGIGSREIA
jgi:hypothetical protein